MSEAITPICPYCKCPLQPIATPLPTSGSYYFAVEAPGVYPSASGTTYEPEDFYDAQNASQSPAGVLRLKCPQCDRIIDISEPE